MNEQRDTASAPDWVPRLDYWGRRVIGFVMVLALVFTMVNVQQFAANNEPGSWWWWTIAWLLDPMATITAATAIVFEVVLAQHGKPRVGWLTATKWYALGCTWAMNVWSSFVGVNPAGILLHSVAPGLVFLVAESAPRVWTYVTEISAAATTVDPVSAPANPDSLPSRPHPTQQTTASAFTSPIPAPTASFPVVTQPARPATAPTRAVSSVPAGVSPLNEVDEALVRRAQGWKAERAAAGQQTGWRPLQTQYRLSQAQAKELARRINPPRQTARALERVS
jgi:hypothetical protein